MLDAIASIAGGIIDNVVGWNQAEKDREEQRTQNQLTRDREDNAVQRRVLDLQAAGLSPTLAAGSAASASQVQALPPSPKTNIQQNLSQAMAIMGQHIQNQKTAEDVKLAQAQQSALNVETQFKERMMPTQEAMLQEQLQNQRINNALAETLNPYRIQQAMKQVEGLDISNTNASLETQQKRLDQSITRLNINRQTMENNILRIEENFQKQQGMNQRQARLAAVTLTNEAIKRENWFREREEKVRDQYGPLNQESFENIREQNMRSSDWWQGATRGPNAFIDFMNKGVNLFKGMRGD